VITFDKPLLTYTHHFSKIQKKMTSNTTSKTPFESWKNAISREISKEDEEDNNVKEIQNNTPTRRHRLHKHLEKLKKHVDENVRLATPKAVRMCFEPPKSDKENSRKRDSYGERPKLGQELFSEPSLLKSAQMKNRKSGRKTDSSSSRKFRRPFVDVTKRRNINFEEDGDGDDDDDIESGIIEQSLYKRNLSYDVMIIVKRSGTSYPGDDLETDMTKGMRSRKEKAARRLAAAAGDSIAITKIKLEEAGFHVSSPHCLNRLENDDEEMASSSKQHCCCSPTECFVRLGAEDWDGMLCCRCLRKKMTNLLGNANLVLLRAYASNQSIVRHCFQNRKDAPEDKEQRDRFVSRLSSAQRHLLIARILATSASEGGAELRPEHDPYIKKIIPMHDTEYMSLLSRRWVWQEEIPQDNDNGECVEMFSIREQHQIWNHGMSGSRTRRGMRFNDESSKTSEENKNKSNSCCNVRRLIRRVRTAFDQPLDDVAAYFGEHVSFYFAFLGFYTMALSAPSLYGLILFISQWRTGEPNLDTTLVPSYCIFIGLWAEVLPLLWKRYEVGLARRWGVLNFENVERTRPQYKGTWRRDPITGERERVYPRWKRWIRQFVSVSMIALLMLSVLFGIFYSIDTHQKLINEREPRGSSSNSTTRGRSLMLNVDRGRSLGSLFDPISDAFDNGVIVDFGVRAAMYVVFLPHSIDSFMYSLICSFLTRSLTRPLTHSLHPNSHTHTHTHSYGLMIPGLSMLFESVAYRCNDFENHRTETSHHGHLAGKVFSIRFVVNFAPLYYYAFMTQNKTEPFEIIGLQLFGTFLTVVVLRRVLQVLWLQIQLRWKEERLSQARRQIRLFPVSNNGNEMRRGRDRLEWLKDDEGEQAWKQATMLGDYSHFEDFADISIQFGYVTFFSVAFPLVPLLCLLANVVKIRTDAYRLCHLTRRPSPLRASGIGVWLGVQRTMARVALLTNCLHIALSSKQVHSWLPDDTSDAEEFGVYIGIEHVMIVLIWLIYMIVPTVPHSIKRALKRERRVLKSGDMQWMIAGGV